MEQARGTYQGLRRSRVSDRDRDDLLVGIGRTASLVGSAGFHEALLDLVQSVVPGDRRMVVRYFQAAPPEMFGCVGVPQALMDLYMSGYYSFDPFLHHWRRTKRYGVVQLRDVVAPELARAAYMSVFIVKAGYRDEVGIFLPWVGRSCIALFLERLHRRVTPTEIARLRRLHPVLIGLNKAHLSRQYCALVGGTQSLTGLGQTRGLQILDARGIRVHANRVWLAFERTLPNLDDTAKRLSALGPGTHTLPTGHLLHVEILDSELSLAPSGRAMVLEAPNSVRPETDQTSYVAQAYGSRLTTREQAVVRLVLSGNPTQRIATTLQISVGAVRNHKSRIYAKLDITTERELFLDFCGHVLARRAVQVAEIRASFSDRRSFAVRTPMPRKQPA